MTRIHTVIGSGTTALACALFAARHRPVRLSARLPTRRVRSVESVPAAALTLLLELGITPEELGVRRITRGHVVAWTDAAVRQFDGPACAHIDTAALHQALCRRATAHSAITWTPPMHPSAARPGWVDATGRRAVLAQAHLRPPQTWTAALVTVRSAGADERLHLASADDGYAFRLGSAHWTTCGWVSPGRPPLDGAALRARIERANAGWMLADLELPCNVGTYRRPATAALPTAGAAIPIGDAALTRDALASQGVAIGVSDACLVADPATTTAAMAARRAQGADRHLTHLIGMVASCRHAEAACWSEYAQWLARTAREHRRLQYVSSGERH